MYPRASISRRVILLALCALLVSLVSTGQGAAQPESKKMVTVTGKIVYIDRIASYMLKGRQPPEEYMISNPDPKVLKPLVESRTQVTVEGTRHYGVDYLVIHTLNGAPYPPASAPGQ